MAALRLELLGRSDPHSFSVPSKRINEGSDLSRFLISLAYRDITIFLVQLNHSMFPLLDGNPSSRSVRTFELGTSDIPFSETILSLQKLLEAIDLINDEVELDKGPRRFGNISYRKYHQLLEDRADDLLKKHLPDQVLNFEKDSSTSPLEEAKAYLLGSFGSAQRLDYGTGHELSFLAFLGCIWKLGGFGESPTQDDDRAIVLGVINPYLLLVRKLILRFNLEPAGSHGVWGLDDHAFLPYVFGSAQYGPPIKSNSPTPVEGSLDGAPKTSDVVNKQVVERERTKNLYFGAIGFIYDVKTGPFWEHSPTLYDISGVKAGWGKINKGMVKMYDAEVLGKFPVVQHFPFGSLFSFEQDPQASQKTASVHAAQSRLPTATSAPGRTAAPPPGMPVTQAPWATPRPGLGQEGGTKAPWAAGGNTQGVSRPPPGVSGPGRRD